MKLRLGRTAAVVAVAAISLGTFEWIGGEILRVQVGREFQLTVDHRLVPNSKPDINSDGIRCEDEAEDFDASTFNIIFLGDSFTYGSLLFHMSEAFPALIEERLNDEGSQVRTINFGWPSSSPLLSDRLLADLGARYSPDLVVMCLDLTDFRDDPKYARTIRFPRMSPTKFLLREMGWAWLIPTGETPRWWPWPDDRAPLPNTYFIVNQPLAESGQYLGEIEGNLRRMERRVREDMEAEFVLVLLARGLQYSDRESPNYGGRGLYTPLGPFVLEPNRWFETYCSQTGFQCFSVLEAFRTSKVFPTCYDHDPHWNASGHRVAASALAVFLRDGGHVPEGSIEHPEAQP